MFSEILVPTKDITKTYHRINYCLLNLYLRLAGRKKNSGLKTRPRLVRRPVTVLVASYYSLFIFVLTETRKELKRPETSRNNRKPVKTTPQNRKRSETTRHLKLGNLEFSTSFRFSNFEPKCPNKEAIF